MLRDGIKMPMKWALLLTLFSLPVFAKPIVLVSYYDAFGKAPFNNSERVAKAVAQKLGNSDVEIKLCELQTVFDKAYGQLEDCIKAQDQMPAMVIGLGEATCDLKVEFATRNFDKTAGPDNEGNERKGEIIPGSPGFIAMRYPLPQMYCALGPKERGVIEISSNAGSFVCNNTAYQMNHYHPELMFGFIHVPAHNCRGLAKKNNFVVNVLSTMILKGVEFLGTQFLISPRTPHSSNEIRMPLLKDQIYEYKMSYEKTDKCVYEFFKNARGVDQQGFWSFLD